MTQPGQSNMGSWGGGSPAGDAAGQYNQGAGPPPANIPYQLWTRNSPTGTTLVNSAQNLLNTTSPNDGALHFFKVHFSIRWASIYTGGVINVTFTINGQTATKEINPGNNSGTNGVAAADDSLEGVAGMSAAFACDPNTAITVSQTAMPTATTVIFYGAILGL